MAWEKNAGKKDALADYITVNERIIKFYEKYPEGSMQAEIIEQGVDANGTEYILMRALVYRTPLDPRPGIGHAHETREGFINKDSMVENCETSAWGRALASLGLEVKKAVASKEEVINAQRRAEGKVELTPEQKEQAELDTKKRMQLFNDISGLHDSLKLTDSKESVEKKNALKDKAQIESTWNNMTIEDLEKYKAILEVELEN
jgi:hypothetical protein